MMTALTSGKTMTIASSASVGNTRNAAVRLCPALRLFRSFGGAALPAGPDVVSATVDMRGLLAGPDSAGRPVWGRHRNGPAPRATDQPDEAAVMAALMSLIAWS